MIKEKYETAEMDISVFQYEDIVTASPYPPGPGPDPELQDMLGVGKGLYGDMK